MQLATFIEKLKTVLAAHPDADVGVEIADTSGPRLPDVVAMGWRHDPANATADTPVAVVYLKDPVTAR